MSLVGTGVVVVGGASYYGYHTIRMNNFSYLYITMINKES